MQQAEVKQATVHIPLIDIELRGAGKQLYGTIEPEMMLSGPAECVAGETLILDPTTGMETPIAELAHHGKPITVLTMNGPRHADAPFLKGNAPLYRVTVEGGKSFLATKRHLVLSAARGWRLVGDLAPGDSLLISEPDIPVLSEGLRVLDVTYERTDAFYDMTVPDGAHYFAQGFWHHNTGKTWSSLIKLHNLAAKYPKSQWLILRDTQQSVYSTVVKSFEAKVLPMMGWQGITKYGGNKPEWFDYANGARIWIGGLDNVTKILSGEFDGIYINQAEEITLNDWESLTTRVTGRAGNVPHPHIWGDCNPGASTHWIIKRRDEGKLRFLESRHEDNPRLYDASGVITEEGIRTIATLDRLSGVRLQRLRYGRWVAAEGVIYEEFDRNVHIVEPFEIPKTWRRFRSIDLGFVNPTVCQWWAMDEDGRMFCYREIYKSQTLMRDHADEINRLTAGVPRSEWRELSAESKKARVAAGEKIEATVCDHDASDRADLRAGGIFTVAAEKDVKTGIEAVQARLRKQADGRPRLFFFNNCLVEADQALIDQGLPYSTVQEFDSYIWQKAADGKAAKEEPTKLNDHGLDCARYATKYGDKRKHKYG